MTAYKKYSEQKDCNVPWLQEIPSHWGLRPLYSIATVRNGYPFKSELFTGEGCQGDRLVRIRDILSDDKTVFTNEDCPPSARISSGDLLIGMDGDFNVHIWDRGPAKLNQRMCAVSGDNDKLTRFLGYLLPAPLKVINDLAYATTVKHLSAYEVLHTLVPLPTADEISSICSELQREVARIDALIEKKTRFIELLKEKRQALITRAVTKGLDPEVPMKDSGVQWIGKTPKHWRVLSLKRVSNIGNGSTPARTNTEYWEGGDFPWLNSSVVNAETVEGAEQFVTTMALRECHLPIVEPPAILVGITGQGRTRAMATTLKVRSTINQHIAFVKPHELKVDPSYLRSVLDAAYHWLRLISGGVGSTKAALTCEQLGSLAIALPPLDEQTEIVKLITASFRKIDALMEKTARSAELLSERRAALITAAVTGQIDLRQEAA